MPETSTPRSRKLALVTGASSGIGLELARLFARNNYDLVFAVDDAGKDRIVAGSFKTKAQAAMAQITPEPMKAEQHRKMAEPGSGSE